jgi:hypothetical protein
MEGQAGSGELAATVGLESLPLDEVPSDKRSAWSQILLGLVRLESEPLAGRASVVLYNWSRSVEGFGILPALVSRYPVPDDGACRNILAAVLSRCGALSADEFDRQLSEWHLPASSMRALRMAHEKYKIKAQDEFQAMIMTSPVFAYIPNLSDDIVV